MLRSYWKIAYRTLIRSKSYALINVFGLAVAISGAALLLMYVNDEMSFDKFHLDAGRIHRIVTADQQQDDTRFYGRTFTPLGKRLVADFSEVTSQLNLYASRSQINFRIDNKRITEESWWMADENFFEFFDFPLVRGDKSKVLRNPFSIVLSETLAEHYFGKQDPIGKVINEYDWGDFIVTGVFQDVPANSHLQFDLIVGENFQSDDNWTTSLNDWTSPRTSTYVKLKEGIRPNELAAKMPEVLKAYRGERDDNYTVTFQPLADVHFQSATIELGTDRTTKGEQRYVVIFASIALFLLVIAAVNYTNLATAKAMFRAKEIGVRKVTGAHNSQLSIQFLTESVLITFMALICAIGIIDLFIPFFNQLTGKELVFGVQALMNFGPILFLLALFVGIISGLYPALFITRFKVISALKGEGGVSQNAFVKKGLVVLQFGMSIVLIVATLVVSKQMTFIQNADLGFDKEGVIVIDINSGDTRRDFKLMKTQFEAIPGVSHVSTSSKVPGEWKNINQVFIKNTGSSNAMDSLKTYYMSFDVDSKATFDLELSQGNYFSGNEQSDSTKVLLNEAAVKAFNLEHPIGANIRVNRSNQRFLNATVIGVLKDFNFQSFHSKIEPLVIGAWNAGIQSVDYFALKADVNVLPRIISDITMVHNRFDPATTIEYNFLDDQLAKKYETENRANSIFQLGAGLSIFVACLGLFGLASFTVQKRAKELGVRKVLGASSWNLFYLLSSAFTKQVLLAILISSPLAFLLMSNWLNKFVYHVELGPKEFVLAGLSVLFIAFFTVSYRAIKASFTNPIGALRSE